METKFCGTCKWYWYRNDDDDNMVCSNICSLYYDDVTEPDDFCEEWESTE